MLIVFDLRDGLTPVRSPAAPPPGTELPQPGLPTDRPLPGPRPPLPPEPEPNGINGLGIGSRGGGWCPTP